MILLDTNILVRMSDRLDARYALTRAAIFKARRSDSLVLAPQTLYEFAAVASRARIHNGLELPVSSLHQWMHRYRALFPTLADPPDLLDVWQRLIHDQRVTGFRVHDARYVAFMQVHGIQSIMTYNVKHFQQFPITIMDPASV